MPPDRATVGFRPLGPGQEPVGDRPITGYLFLEIDKLPGGPGVVPGLRSPRGGVAAISPIPTLLVVLVAPGNRGDGDLLCSRLVARVRERRPGRWRALCLPGWRSRRGVL